MHIVPLLMLLIAAVHADPLGPLPAGTTLRETTEHPEFVRYHLTSTDGGSERAFIIELTQAAADSESVCAGGGADLWVRQDLADGSESFDWDPLPAIVDQACERLGEHAPDLRGRMSSTPAPIEGEIGEGPSLDSPQPRTQVWPWRALHVVVLGWFALLVAAAPRSLRAWGLGLGALAVRAALSPQRVLLGGDAAFERLLTAQGLEGSNLYYGDGWPALMGLLWKLTGGMADHALAANLALSALAVPLLYGCVKALTGDRWAAGAAALMLAILPLPVALSGSELHFVLAGTLQVSALYGAARGDRLGGLLSAVSLGLLVHLRPMQAAFVLLPLGLLAWRRRWEGLALGLALVGWRAVALLGHLQGETPSVLQQSNLHFIDLLPGAASALVPLNPAVTPVALMLLAVAALRPGAHARSGWLLGGAALLGTLPYLPLTTDSVLDPMRFQLPAQAWLCGMAAVTLAGLRGAEQRITIIVGATLMLSWWTARAPIGPDWAWTEEHRFLSREAPRVPAGTVVRYDGSQDPELVFHAWINERSPAAWLPLSPVPLQAGEWRYVGTADRLSGGSEGVACGAPVVAQEITPLSDGWVNFGERALTLGLYRVEACDEEETE